MCPSERSGTVTANGVGGPPTSTAVVASDNAPGVFHDIMDTRGKLGGVSAPAAVYPVSAATAGASGSAQPAPSSWCWSIICSGVGGWGLSKGAGAILFASPASSPSPSCTGTGRRTNARSQSRFSKVQTFLKTGSVNRALSFECPKAVSAKVLPQYSRSRSLTAHTISSCPCDDRSKGPSNKANCSNDSTMAASSELGRARI
mmetsp:Transcript_49754/g.131258  ORF Transcript_49754/g.131258 Transcript_49754/m.131258 type:complete len:202 (-) Transcript_49754:505-1110(-)